MKKKLKGLIAMIMAIAMIMPMTTSAFGSISEEIASSLDSYDMGMYLISTPKFEMEVFLEREESFGADDHEKYDEYGDYEWDFVSSYYDMGEVYKYGTEFGEITGWTIWEVKEDGCVHRDSKSKDVPRDYCIDPEDILEYGYADDENVYMPYIEARYDLEEFSLYVYDETGTNIIDTIVYDAMIEETDDLYIPEGYVGYMMYSDGEGWGDIYGDQDVFICSYSDILREISYTDYFDYEPRKLVLTKKMPYKILAYNSEDEWQLPQAGMGNVVWLEPGESINDNEVVKEYMKNYNTPEGEVEWSVWTVWYCGYSVTTIPDKTTTGLDPETYSYTRVPFDYDIYYYSENYPVLLAVIDYDKYEFAYYEMNGEKGKPFCIDYALEEYYEEAFDYITELFSDYEEGMKPDKWDIYYEGVKVSELYNVWDIWNVIGYDGEGDSSKLEIRAVCENHIYDYDNGRVDKEPTVDSMGTTAYPCKRCGTPDIVENIDKLMPMNTATIENDVYIFNGTAVMPNVTVNAYVNDELKTLTKDVDYTVTYSNNNKPGIGTVTIKGIGKFGGTKTLEYTIKPAQITNLKVTSGEKKNILSWSEVTGATGYKVYASSHNGEYKLVGTTTKTSYTNSGLADGTKYSYKVVAYVSTSNGDIEGAQSAVATSNTKTKLNAVKLSKTTYTYTGKAIKPEVKVTVKVNGKEVTLTSTDYKIEYKNNKNPGVGTVTITGKGNYYGTLTAQFTIKPNWVKNVKQVAASTYTKNLKISWSSVTGATGYEVYKSTKKNGTYTLAGTTTKTAFVSKNLQPGTSYYYKVRAYKTVDGKKIYGSYSSVLKATTKTVAPSKVMTSVKSKKTNVKWYYSKGAVGYEVYMSTNAKYIGSKVATTTSSVKNVNLTDLKKGKTYYVRVRAYTTTATGTKLYTPFTDYVSFKAK